MIMRSQLGGSILVLGATAVVAMLWGAATSVGGQTPVTYKAPRTSDGQPDLNGYWQAVNSANWNIEEHQAQAAPFEDLVGTYLAQPAGLSVVEGNTIPYKPEALAERKRLFEGRLTHDPLLIANPEKATSDPEAKCFQGGVPRATYMSFPFQIVQAKNKVFIGYEYAGSVRMVHLDQTFADLLDIATWMGQSIGRWEGDTLVVEAKSFSGPTIWLDRAGNYFTDQARVTERYTASSPYHLRYEATIEDPTVFTRPWKISMPLYRRMDANMQLLEFQCIPFAEEFMFKTLKKPPAKPK